MSALIHFVGIITLVTQSTFAPPPYLLMPRFRDIIPKENNVITVLSTAVDRANTNWPLESASGGQDNYLIDVRNITISGTDPLALDPDIAVPHLTCCCVPMRDGLDGDYASPEPDVKKAALVSVNHGFLFSTRDPKT